MSPPLKRVSSLTSSHLDSFQSKFPCSAKFDRDSGIFRPEDRVQPASLKFASLAERISVNQLESMERARSIGWIVGT